MEKLNESKIFDNEAELRKGAKEGLALLDNTMEQYKRELEKLVQYNKITEAEMKEEYSNLLQDKEKLEELRLKMLKNIEETGNDKREEVIEKLKNELLERRKQAA